jgi:hypothetical protein
MPRRQQSPEGFVGFVRVPGHGREHTQLGCIRACIIINDHLNALFVHGISSHEDVSTLPHSRERLFLRFMTHYRSRGGGGQRLATPPSALPARQRAALSAAPLCRCGRRPPRGGTVWPRRPRRPRPWQTHRGSKKRGAWRHHGMGRCQRWSRRKGAHFAAHVCVKPLRDA